MTKKRYYYTDPVKAAYMSKEFGVKYMEQIGAMVRPLPEESYKWIQENPTVNWCSKFYVAKESESIFDPHFIDRGINRDGVLFYYDCEGNWIDEYFFEPAIDYDKIDIIMRDNKHFMAPKIEIIKE